MPSVQFAHLSNPPDILVAVPLTKTKILVQAKANIIPIEPVGSKAEVEQMLLEGNGNC